VLSTTLPLSASTTIFDNDADFFVGGQLGVVGESDDPGFRTFGYSIDRALVPGVDRDTNSI
jgi:hypothetical protein